MKRSMKRGKSILGIILAVTMMMGVIPMEGLQFVIEVCARETEPTSGTCGKNGGDNLTWELSDDKILTISGTGEMEDWTYHSPWSDYTFNGISVRRGIKKVIISNGVTTIGNHAFYDCHSITEISIPNSVTKIGENAFNDCWDLREIKIPDSVTTIGERAFTDCTALKEIKIPDGVTTIEKETFFNCTFLTEISIPDSVTKIGDLAFSLCGSLTDVYYSGSEEEWNNIDISSASDVIYGSNEDLINANIHYNSTGSENPEEPDNPDSSGDFQCGSFFSVEVGKYGYLTATASAGNLESLKTLTNSITWTSSDESIATVKGGGFILGSYPIEYETEQGTYERWNAIAGIRIDGISEGSTIITGKAPGRSDVTCEVTVVKPPATEEEEIGNGGSLILGEDISGSADEDSGVFEFFPGNWSLKNALFPVEISIKEDTKTHNYEVRGTVGIGKADWLNDDTTWSKYKKNVSDANRYTGRVDCLEKYADTWDVKSMTAMTTDKFNVLPKLSVMGYIENTYDKNWNLISGTGKLAADAKWEGSINWQFVTPIGPLYLNLKGSGKLTGSLGPKYNYDEKKLEIVDGQLKMIPSVALEGGYGIDKVATVGAEGSLSLPVTLIPATKGDLEAKAALNVNLVFVIDYSHDLAKYTKHLWDTTDTLKSKSIQARKGAVFSTGTLSEIDTSSLNDASAWNTGNRQTAKVRARNAATDTEVTLLDGVLGGSLPMQAEIGGKRVMVFQSYDSSRITLNSPVLMYSVYENNAWSEPKAVWDTGTADMYADMKVVDGKLVLVWQKEKTEITGDVTNDSENVLKQMAQNSEICFAVFDEENNTFSAPVYVTENDSCDMMPRICDNSDEIVVSWVRNDADDLMQETGINTIYTAAWNGTTFDEETELVKASGTVDDYVLYKNGDAYETIFAGQSNEMTAMFDTDGRVIEELSDLFMFSEDGSISSMQYVDGQIISVSNGTLYSYNPADRTVETYLAGESAFGAEIQYASNSEKSGYVWSLYDEETGTGSIVASMKTENGYSEPVTLYEKENTIWRYASPTIDENGNWQFVANAEDVANGTHSLVSIVKAPKTGVALAGASVDENDKVNGETGVDYFLTNTGDTPVTELELTITLSDGKTVTKKVPVNILPGEDAVGTAYVDLSDADTKQNIQISISGEEQTDTSECTVEDTIGLPDVSVTGSYIEDGENIQVTAVIANESTTDTEVLLTLFSDETQKMELEKKNNITLKAREKQSISFTVPKNKIIYNENDAAYLTLKAEATGGDYKEDNNITYIVLYKEKTPGTDPGDSTGSSGTESEIPTTGTTETPSQPSGSGNNSASQTMPAQNNGRQSVPPAGTILTDNRTKAVYMVTEPGISVAYAKNLNTKAKAITIPSAVTIGNVTYKVTSIGNKAFKNNKKLKKVSIASSITNIGNSAFQNCMKLKKVTIPAQVKKIGKKAFYNCKNLQSVLVKAKKLTAKSVGNKAFTKAGSNNYRKLKVKVPSKKYESYSKIFRKKGLSSKVKIIR
ncbi:leucine-rich repeat domain-containing protein [Eubacterium sp. An3]|uniref:leucine-rich repeat domain-containing protein n=1 Tax=Eubacterium sp. An3 TaxID=1965628 RepID=UPI001302A3BA|nr:leucine-rich repeat domain-containing protein [Eubacterium sp. An3]